jgi:hypothetical protein
MSQSSVASTSPFNELKKKQTKDFRKIQRERRVKGLSYQTYNKKAGKTKPEIKRPTNKVSIKELITTISKTYNIIKR